MAGAERIDHRGDRLPLAPLPETSEVIDLDRGERDLGQLVDHTGHGLKRAADQDVSVPATRQ